MLIVCIVKLFLSPIAAAVQLAKSLELMGSFARIADTQVIVVPPLGQDGARGIGPLVVLGRCQPVAGWAVGLGAGVAGYHSDLRPRRKFNPGGVG